MIDRITRRSQGKSYFHLKLSEELENFIFDLRLVVGKVNSGKKNILLRSRKSQGISHQVKEILIFTSNSGILFHLGGWQPCIAIL